MKNEIDFESCDICIAGSRRLHVCVIGDLILDEYVHGTVTRLSPEAPIPILDINYFSHTIGGAGNVVINLLNMGANVSFYYACGNSETDKIAHKLLNEWEGLLRLHPIVNDSYFIPKKTRYISQNHIQLLRTDVETPYPSYSKPQQLNITLDTDTDLILISDYNKGLLRNTNIMDIVRESGIPFGVDPKPENIDLYHGAKFIKPNNIEYKKIYSELNEMKIPNIVHTLGQYGMILTINEPDKIIIDIPGKETYNVIDACGCGDTAFAVLAMAYLEHNNIELACRIANECAGIVATKPGVAPIGEYEYRQANDYIIRRYATT